jgi:hypothetical protein
VPFTPSTGVTGEGFFGGSSLAIDHQNNVWAVTEGPGAQVSKVSPDGVILSGSGYATTAMQGVNATGVTIAIDGDDNAWTPSGSPAVIELSSTGETLSGSNGYGGGSRVTRNTWSLTAREMFGSRARPSHRVGCGVCLAYTPSRLQS